ncbi:MAG: SLBB domain-containing protein [Candidatus Margulisiibacteriota bacterium]
MTPFKRFKFALCWLLALLLIAQPVFIQAQSPLPAYLNMYQNLTAAEKEKVQQQAGAVGKPLDQIKAESIPNIQPPNMTSDSAGSGKTVLSPAPMPSRIEQSFQYADTDKLNFSIASSTSTSPSSSTKTPDTLDPSPTKLEQFGYAMFRQSSYTGFNLKDVPVGSSYILGPGDALTIQIWGKVEEKIDVTIDQNGKIFMPKVGYLSLAGSSLGSVAPRIKQSLSKDYANFDVSVSIAQLRTIKVFVLGDVNKPGAYDLPSLTTAFMALYVAEGPTKMGSLRKVLIKRRNQVVKTIDLYDYLLRGDRYQDIQLQPFDTIFVPSIGDVAAIRGMVKRPAIFELAPNTSVFDGIMNLSGGTTPGSYTKRIQIQRIVDNQKLSLLDYKFNTFDDLKDELKNRILQNGDIVTILPISEDKHNFVGIEGNIKRPGEYDLKANPTIGDLLKSAEGTKEESFMKRVEILRYVSNDQRQLIYVDLSLPANLKTPLKEWDRIKIYSNADIYGIRDVSIEGAVKKPGNYKLLKDMSVSDVVFLATPTPFAELNRVEIYRKLPDAPNETLTLDLERFLKNPNATENITLKPGDHIFIRENAEATKIRKITLSGEVAFPGTYICLPGEHLSDVIAKAGGFTQYAFLPGSIFKREALKDKTQEGQKIILEQEQKRIIYEVNPNASVNPNGAETSKAYTEAMAFLQKRIEENTGRVIIAINKDFKGSKDDFEVKDGDSLTVPTIPNAILVVGGVQKSTGIAFEDNKSPNHYIDLVGGFSDYADRGNVLVIKANGSILKNPGVVERGDMVYVPEKPKIDINWTKAIVDWTQILFNIATSLSFLKIIK